MTLISSRGTLLNGYQDLLLQTDISLCHADQLMDQRRNKPDLCDQRIYAADGMIYFVENRIPKLAITRRENNPILLNIERAIEELAGRGSYRPSPRDVNLALSEKDTLFIDLTEVNLCPKLERTGTGIYGYISIPTNRYHDQLDNQELQKLVQRFYGRGRALVRNMKMLSEGGIEQTRIFLPNLDYIREHAADRPFALLAWLNSFRFSSNIVSDNCASNEDFHVYGMGKDGAREATFHGKAPYPSKEERWDGSWIFQAKFHDVQQIGPVEARRQLLADIDDELSKITKKY